MPNEELILYIQGELAKGVSRDAITTALLQNGWGANDIEQAFIPSQFTPTITTPTSHEAPTPTVVVSEKEYPITVLWVFKSSIILVVLMVVLLMFDTWVPLWLIVLPFEPIVKMLIRKNFHYQVREHVFWIRQGVFSKKERNLPYGVIQNVFLKQDLFDRIFGLAALKIENAGSGGGKPSISAWQTSVADQGLAQGSEMVGSIGNKINIPGLTKTNAEILKKIILKKTEENPIDDSRSGL